MQTSDGELVFELCAAYQPPAGFIEPSSLSHNSPPSARPRLRLTPPDFSSPSLTDGNIPYIAQTPTSLYSMSSPESTTSPCTPPDVSDLAEGETTWDLIPYDVPWGDEFLDYSKGTLPGPDGTCLLLRSPTPVEKRRAVQACQLCRERKAKCSGDRPACLRCIEKGYRCEYAMEARRVPCVSTVKRRATTSVHEFHPYSQRKTRLGKTASTPSVSASPVFEMHHLPPLKVEDLQFSLPDDGAHEQAFDNSGPPFVELSTTEVQLYAAEYSHASQTFGFPAPDAAPSIHAPIPCRQSPTATFLSCEPLEESQVVADSPDTYAPYTSTSCVDPNVLTNYVDVQSSLTATQFAHMAYREYANVNTSEINAVPFAGTSHVATSLSTGYPTVDSCGAPYVSDYSAAYAYEPAAHTYAAAVNSVYHDYGSSPSVTYLYAH